MPSSPTLHADAVAAALQDATSGDPAVRVLARAQLENLRNVIRSNLRASDAMLSLIDGLLIGRRLSIDELREQRVEVQAHVERLAAAVALIDKHVRT